MRICLFLEAEDAVKKSGFWRAFHSHRSALINEGVDVVLDPDRFDYDVIHLHAFGPRSLYLIRQAKRRGIKVVVHAHSVGAHDFRDSYTMSNVLAPLYERFLMFVYSKADAIFTPTPFAKRMLLESGVSQPVFDISNGVDLDRFTYCEDARSEYRARFSLDRFTVFSAGFVIPRKGIIDFINIARRLPEYDFIWFGHKFARAFSYHPKMDRVLADKPSNVHLAGYVEDPHRAFCAADILLFPSHTETQGMVLLEAAALNRPIVVRGLPEYEDWLVDGVDCLKASSEEQFVTHIRNLAKNKELYNGLAAKAQSTAQEHGMDQIGNRLKNLYQSILDNERILEPNIVQSRE